jgi:MscS family membrane protein
MGSGDFFLQKIYGDTIKDWIISLVIILASILAGKILYWFSGKVLKKLTAKTKSNLDDIIIDMLEEPMVAAIILAGFWFSVDRLHLSPGFDKGISLVYKILIVLNVTWFAARLVNSLIREYLIPLAEKDSNNLDGHVISLIQKALGVIIWVIGGIMSLNNAGINVGALLAGLGIGGLAFALAAQDTVKNIFGGFTIFADKPFRIGDLIAVSGFTGFVEDIGMRSIRLRTLEGRLITIPNYKIVDSNVENITQEPSRRIELKLGLTYDTTPQNMELAMSLLKALPNDFQSIENKTLVFFAGYGEFSLNLTCYYFIKKESDIFETQSAINLYVLQKFNAAGLNFAFPTQTLYVNK